MDIPVRGGGGRRATDRRGRRRSIPALLASMTSAESGEAPQSRRWSVVEAPEGVAAVDEVGERDERAALTARAARSRGRSRGPTRGDGTMAPTTDVTPLADPVAARKLPERLPATRPWPVARPPAPLPAPRRTARRRAVPAFVAFAGLVVLLVGSAIFSLLANGDVGGGVLGATATRAWRSVPARPARRAW